MKTRRSGASNFDTYLALVKRFPLKAIQNDLHYQQTLKVVDELLDRDLDSGESDYLETLTQLVEVYEDSLPDLQKDATVADVLRVLMTSHGDNQAGLAHKAELAKSLISELLSGGRPISLQTARKLAAVYAVPTSVFTDREE